MRVRQAPADLHRRHERRIEPGHSETCQSGERAGLTDLDRPHPEPPALEMHLDPLHEGVALGAAEGCREQLHDDRVAVERGERLEILLPPAPKHQALRLQNRA